jgi:hypothetical protein
MGRQVVLKKCNWACASGWGFAGSCFLQPRFGLVIGT